MLACSCVLACCFVCLLLGAAGFSLVVFGLCFLVLFVLGELSFYRGICPLVFILLLGSVGVQAEAEAVLFQG
jgi:hypothetical protein